MSYSCIHVHVLYMYSVLYMYTCIIVYLSLSPCMFFVLHVYVCFLFVSMFRACFLGVLLVLFCFLFRIEKHSKFSRRREFQHNDDVDYINERNRKFNMKASRFYDKYTAETKQNLERGTAL